MSCRTRSKRRCGLRPKPIEHTRQGSGMAPDQVHLTNADTLIQRGINRSNRGRGFRFADFSKTSAGHSSELLKNPAATLTLFCNPIGA